MKVHRLDLRENPGDDAVGAHIARYDGTWGEHGETDPAHRDEPYSNHSGPGRVRVEYRDQYTLGSPFELRLEGPWGLDATAVLTRKEADDLRRLLEILVLDSDPEWHEHNARVETEIRSGR